MALYELSEQQIKNLLEELKSILEEKMIRLREKRLQVIAALGHTIGKFGQNFPERNPRRGKKEQIEICFYRLKNGKCSVGISAV